MGRSVVGRARRWAAATLSIALAATAQVGVLHAAPAEAASGPGGGALPSVDWATLEREPIQQWGVVGSGTTTNEPKPQVWDFAEIGDRIFVAGTFTGVQQNAFNQTPVQSQAYLAAFDRDSGAWISTFRPTLNATVYALEVSPDGSLLVGGEFTQVNGVARTALVALDPMTGAIRSSFGSAIGRVGGGGAAMVRELAVNGTDLYVVGTFNQVVRGGTGYWVYQATRLRANSGELDPTWLPRPVGSGVWDVLVDSARGRVHLAGYFSSVNASPSTSNLATVSMATGETVTGLTAFTPNDAAQQWTRALGLANDRLYVGGAQHVVQVLNAGTRTRLGYSTSGLGCSSITLADCSPSLIAGGDYQVIETAGNAVLAGCHCFFPYPQYRPTYDSRTHYNSFAGQFSNHRNVVAFDPATSRPYAWFPGLRENFWGAWGLFVDSRACVYVGGDYNRTDAGNWIGGFGRFCNPVQAPTGLTAFSANRTAFVRWTAPSSQLPIARYRVYRGTTFLFETTSTSFADSGATVGSSVTYRVEAVDASGRRSAAVSTAAVTIAGADTVAPAAPATIDATITNGTVVLTWPAATDNQAVSGYLVHRNDQFQAWVPAGLTWTDPNPPVGAVSYKIRTQDYGGNNSAAAERVVTVATDTTPPSSPPNLAGSVAGTSVTLTWGAATDNVGVRGYLVHRDYQFVAWVPAGTTFTDTDVAAGSRLYQVRAQDAAGNNSAPAERTITR